MGGCDCCPKEGRIVANGILEGIFKRIAAVEGHPEGQFIDPDTACGAKACADIVEPDRETPERGSTAVVEDAENVRGGAVQFEQTRDRVDRVSGHVDLEARLDLSTVEHEGSDDLRERAEGGKPDTVYGAAECDIEDRRLRRLSSGCAEKCDCAKACVEQGLKSLRMSLLFVQKVWSILGRP